MPDAQARHHHQTRPRRLAVAAAAAILAAAPASFGQTKVSPGFNLFSVQQDIEIGQQSAREAERQLQILSDGSIEDYVDDLVERLGDAAPGHKFPYQGKVVNAREINAFALPGGPLYVNRGLIEAARTEGELAGVIAHEVAHIALRHGTHNASKAYATQAGIGVLGGILTRGKTRTTADIINVVGGLGLNAVFLKYGRDAETQADIVGAQILAKAGYDPMEMAHFFELLRQQRQKDPSRLEQFFSSHPAPADRAARVQQEAKLISAPSTSRESGEFRQVQAELKGMPAGRAARGSAGSQAPQTRSRTGTGRTADVRVDPPSSRFESFRQRQGAFEIDHPDNWRAYEAQDGFGVTIVPEGGVVDSGNGSEAIIYGVIVNHYDPFENTTADRITLDDAMADLVSHIRDGNAHLRASGPPRRETVDGHSARSVVLSGTSPVTGAEERVTVFARQMGDGHVLYALFVAPGRDAAAYSRTFAQMKDSLRVNDDAAHGMDDN
jgi:Zn-dependent protease with chaperone function